MIRGRSILGPVTPALALASLGLVAGCVGSDQDPLGGENPSNLGTGSIAVSNSGNTILLSRGYWLFIATGDGTAWAAHEIPIQTEFETETGTYGGSIVPIAVEDARFSLMIASRFHLIYSIEGELQTVNEITEVANPVFVSPDGSTVLDYDDGAYDRTGQELIWPAMGSHPTAVSQDWGAMLFMAKQADESWLLRALLRTDSGIDEVFSLEREDALVRRSGSYAISPGADSVVILDGGSNLWAGNAAHGLEVVRSSSTWSIPYYDVFFTDQPSVVVMVGNTKIMSFNITTGDVIAERRVAEQPIRGQEAVSANGKYLVRWSEDGVVRVFSLPELDVVGKFDLDEIID